MVSIKLKKDNLAKALLTEEEYLAKKLFDCVKYAYIIKYPEKRAKIIKAYDNLLGNQFPRTIKEAIDIFDVEMAKPEPTN